MANDAWNAIQAERARLEQVRENSARHATSFHSYTSVGTGSIVLPDPYELQTPMTHEPWVQSGFAIIEPPNLEVYQMPRVTAGVYRWERSERGFYVGAYVYFAVDCPPIEPEGDLWDPLPRPEIVHYLAFSGVSFKDISGSVAGSIEPLEPPMT